MKKTALIVLASTEDNDITAIRERILHRYSVDLTTGAVRMSLVAHVRHQHVLKDGTHYRTTENGRLVLESHRERLLQYSMTPHEWLIHRLTTGAMKRIFVFDEGAL